MVKSLQKTTYRELLLLLLHRRKRFKVVGESMMPLLQPGDEILLDLDAYKEYPPQIGDIIVTLHPLQVNLPIVKRITALKEDNSYFVTGDNGEASTDSRHWGTIKFSDIIGKVTSKFH
jgi:nickel-type superoxide dismutase maturation protease